MNNRADNFLHLIRQSQRGRLKIYMGYAAGVGKTSQMLMEAQRLKKDGIDVVIGLVETHQRVETKALLADIEVIPRKKMTYHGIEIEEMDLDAILARRPHVVLVDELAHMNVPGSKNAKRYQDVEEILAEGIHVISALNVQHLESLYETVEKITGVKVKERVPDRIVAEADQLVNVDVTTEDLCRRVKDGKVYTQERIETALQNFFKSANLEQLRELVLRELAAQIDLRQRDPLSEVLPSSPDQVMVCLSSRGAGSEVLLRYASRLAGRLNRNWYAVYVQTSQEGVAIMDPRTQKAISDALILAKQLGATVFTYKGEDIVKTILQFAKEYRVGHIVIGAPSHKISFWRRLKGEVSILERIVTEGSGITLVVLDTREVVKDQIVEQEQAKPQNTGENLIQECEKILLETPVLMWDQNLNKEDAMHQLLDVCYPVNSGVRKIAWDSLLEREKQGGTYVGDDIAMPHARITGLTKPIVALGIAKAGIIDQEAGRKIHLMFLLLSPLDAPKKHVAMLGVISRVVQNEQWCKNILAVQNVAEAKSFINS